MKIPRSCSSIFFVAVMSALLQGATGPAPHVSIILDASDAPRKIFHAQLTIPAAPGALTLYYPKWIPGEHAPSGPVIFMIDGFDGVVQGESPSGKPLFIGYKVQLDLPKQASEQNIDVPESAGASAKARYGAVP